MSTENNIISKADLEEQIDKHRHPMQTGDDPDLALQNKTSNKVLTSLNKELDVLHDKHINQSTSDTQKELDGFKANVQQMLDTGGHEEVANHLIESKNLTYTEKQLNSDNSFKELVDNYRELGNVENDYNKLMRGGYDNDPKISAEDRYGELMEADKDLKIDNDIVENNLSQNLTKDEFKGVVERFNSEISHIKRDRNENTEYIHYSATAADAVISRQTEIEEGHRQESLDKSFKTLVNAHRHQYEDAQTLSHLRENKAELANSTVEERSYEAKDNTRQRTEFIDKFEDRFIKNVSESEFKGVVNRYDDGLEHANKDKPDSAIKSDKHSRDQAVEGVQYKYQQRHKQEQERHQRSAENERSDPGKRESAGIDI